MHVPAQTLREDLAAGWAEVRARTWYWTSLIGHATWNFAAGLLATTGPLIAITELGGKTVWLAALEASAVGYLAGAFLAGRTKVSRAVLVGNFALMSYAVPLILFAIAAPAWAVVTAYGLAMACLGFLNPVWETAVQQEIPAAVLARVSAYDWLVSLGAMPLGFALGPILVRQFGYTWPLTGAAILVVITLAVPVSLPDVRNLRLRHALAEAPPQDAPPQKAPQDAPPAAGMRPADATPPDAPAHPALAPPSPRISSATWRPPRPRPRRPRPPASRYGRRPRRGGRFLPTRRCARPSPCAAAAPETQFCVPPPVRLGVRRAQEQRVEFDDAQPVG